MVVIAKPIIATGIYQVGTRQRMCAGEKNFKQLCALSKNRKQVNEEMRSKIS